jgi:hypothetical protein
MMEMCRYLILNDGVTADISLNQAARARNVAHVKSTTFHIVKGFVTLQQPQALLKAPRRREEEPSTHIAKPGDSLSLIAGYPKVGWQERLSQLIKPTQSTQTLRAGRQTTRTMDGWRSGTSIKIPWDKEGDVEPGQQPPMEVRDLDGYLWYSENWTQTETNAQARKNRGIGADEDPSLAYEGYEVSDERRLPNSLDPTHPPVSQHVHGLAIDAEILWSKKTWSGNPNYWAESVTAIINTFKLQRPVDASNPYGPSEAEPWHFEKL